MLRLIGLHSVTHSLGLPARYAERPSSPGVPERPNIPGVYIPNFLHFLALDARILVLLITLIVLFKPSKTYSTVAHAHGGAHPEATPSTLLLPASLTNQNNANQHQYGTFAQPHDPPKAHANGESYDAAPLAGAGKDGLKHAEGYDAGSSSHHGPAEGSSSRSVHSKKDQPIAVGEVTEEPESLAPKQTDADLIPVTDDPNALTTSCATAPAKHADEEETAKPTTESPTAFAFPSTTRDDSSSLRGVTFSAEAVERGNGENGDGEEVIGIDGKKRRRISSQNFKRIVRKIQDIPKRQGSISSLGSASRSLGTPGLEGPAGQGQTTPRRSRASREDSRMSGEGSVSYTPGESPNPSIGDDARKQRFRKRLSLSLRGPPPREGSKDYST